MHQNDRLPEPAYNDAVFTNTVIILLQTFTKSQCCLSFFPCLENPATIYGCHFQEKSGFSHKTKKAPTEQSL